MHLSDLAVLFRLALEKGPAGSYWHAVGDEGIPLREVAEAIGSRLGVPAAITRRVLGWEPTHPGLLADLDNGHKFPTT